MCSVSNVVECRVGRYGGDTVLIVSKEMIIIDNGGSLPIPAGHTKPGHLNQYEVRMREVDTLVENMERA